MVHRNSGVRAILVVALVASFAASARAECECPTMPTVTESLAGATAVFEGTVIEQIPTMIWYEPAKGSRRLLPTQKVRFHVDRVWKGNVGPEVTILEGSDDCSYWFQRGSGTHLIFATPHESERGSLGVDKCAQPWGIGAKNDLIIKALGEAKTTYAAVPPPAIGWVGQAVQNSSVYFVTGTASIYSQLLGDIPLEEPWRWLPALEALLALSLVGAVWMIGRRFSILSTIAIAIVVIVIYAAALLTATGAVVVHQSDSWLQHLLEGYVTMASSDVA